MVPIALAANFSSKEQASTVYFAIRERILAPRKQDSNVAVFLWLKRAEHAWRIAVIGAQPPADILSQLTEALAGGSPYTLSHEEDTFFLAQIEAAASKQPWIEKQYFTSEDTW